MSKNERVLYIILNFYIQILSLLEFNTKDFPYFGFVIKRNGCIISVFGCIVRFELT